MAGKIRIHINRRNRDHSEFETSQAHSPVRTNQENELTKDQERDANLVQQSSKPPDSKNYWTFVFTTLLAFGVTVATYKLTGSIALSGSVLLSTLIFWCLYASQKTGADFFKLVE